MAVSLKDQPQVSITDFLEGCPPGRQMVLAESNFEVNSGNRAMFGFVLQIRPISQYCGQENCSGVLTFEPSETAVPIGWGVHDDFLYFTCRNCTRTTKSFAVRFSPTGGGNTRSVFKFGETPSFGPPLAAKLLQLAGPDGEALRKGRQSENQSLGIGAFAYYRRVVERQKARLADELKNAISRLGGAPAIIEKLEAAKRETQFSKSITMMADVTPKELYVSGRNPLVLLHGPLSVGIHGLSDEDCLKLAHNIRVVLSALLERIQAITEEKAELDAAIKELLEPIPTVTNRDSDN